MINNSCMKIIGCTYVTCWQAATAPTSESPTTWEDASDNTIKNWQVGRNIQGEGSGGWYATWVTLPPKARRCGLNGDTSVQGKACKEDSPDWVTC